MKKSQYLGLIIAISTLILMNFLPASELLSRSAVNNIAILIAVIVLFITEPIPIGVTCLFSIPLLVIFNVTPDVVPVAIVALPIAWLIIVKVYGVTELSVEEIQQFVKDLDVPKTMDFKEIYVIALMLVMFVLWLLSSWYPVFNITVVILVGFTLLFLPGYQILSWNEFVSSVSWPAFFLLGSIITIGDALIANEVTEWLIASFFPGAINLPLVGITFAVSIIVFLMLIVVPVAPALIPLLAVPLAGLATNMNMTPVLPVMTLGLAVANCFLLPLDTVPIITYMTGYYEMWEMPKSTAFIQLALAAAIAIWLPIALKMLGYL